MAMCDAEYADMADHNAGLAFRRGDLDTAARLIAEARGLDPQREPVWASRELRIKTAESSCTPLVELIARRHSRSGILPDDPGLQQLRAWNRSIGMEPEL
jgi:hypothetical protein